MIKLFLLLKSHIKTNSFYGSEKMNTKVFAGSAVKCVLIFLCVNFDHKCIHTHNPV